VIIVKKSEEGFTNPLGSSAYFPPPYPFKNAETVMIEFEAPREAIEAELPEPLEFQSGTAFAVVQDAQIASGAPFHEGYIFVRAKYRDQFGFYAPYVFGCPEEAVLANREMYGWPEMIVDYPHPRHMKDGHTVTGTVQRRGELLMKASVTLERRAKLEELPNMDDNLTLRKIPSPLKDGRPVRQVIHIRLEDSQLHDLWAGRGLLELGNSAQFKIRRLQPTRIVNAYYMVISWTLPHARSVWDV
jgi:acetoacetate decarboxylase